MATHYEVPFEHGVIELRNGDITEVAVDAVVNAANGRLAHGGGVAAAIARCGGAVIQHESDAWVCEHGPVPTGEVAITEAGRLPAQWVIHAVGPRMGEGDEDETLRAATKNSLQMAEAKGLGSIAFPAISTGIFGYPLDRCANIMIACARAFVSSERSLDRIVFVLFGARSFETFCQVLEGYDDRR